MAARTTPWVSWPRRLRLLPVLMGLAALLAVTKIERMLWGGQGASPGVVVATAQAQGTPTPTPPPAAAPAPTPPPAAAPAPAPAAPSAEAQAERAVLEALRARRAEIEAREQSAAAREQVVSAAERRLGQRIAELTALQQRLEALERDRAAREEAGMRGLVRLYEGMRPRDAATIFDELEMPVLVSIVDRMREAKASPVIGAMKPERARLLTAELARLRAERVASR
jgi:flagellar motility protein MotE (MotC chaperone)